MNTLLKVILLAWIFGFSSPVRAQIGDAGGGSYIDNVPTQVIPREFSKTFPDSKSRQSFSKLNSFLEEKKTQLAKIQVMDQGLQYEVLAAGNFFSYFRLLSDLSKNNLKPFLNTPINKIPGDKIDQKTINFLYNFAYTVNKDSVTINSVYPNLLQKSDDYRRKQSQDTVLNASIKNIKSDIDDAVEEIQNIYNIDSTVNSTRLYISITFVILMLIVLALFFYFLMRKQSEALARIFLEGSGLQYIALFCLIISIVLFGVLGILEARELAAILSGISGFILGRETMNRPPKPASGTGGAGPTDGASTETGPST